MRSTFEAVRVIVITDGLGSVEAVLPHLLIAHGKGALFSMLVRDYGATPEARVSFAGRVRAALPASIPVLLAGAPAEARAAGVDGVHLGRRIATIAHARAVLGPEAWVSVPAHTARDVDVAAREGAYACLVSPVCETPDKGPPLGFSGLRSLLDVAHGAAVRVFALGGVGHGDVAACLRAGASGVAVIRSVWHAPSPADALVELAGAAARHTVGPPDREVGGPE